MNNKHNNELIVDETFEGKRIDYFLKKRFSSLSYPLICKIIRKGLVKVDNKRIKNTHILKTKNIIKLFININDKPKPSFNVDNELSKKVKSWVIFKDENFIAINKPSGVAVQGGTKVKISLDNLLEALKFRYSTKPKLVHRIDKKTSGVLLVARNIQYAQYFTSLFKDRLIEKKYLLLVNGNPEIRKGYIDKPILTTKKELDSRTYFSVLKTYKNQSLILAFPITGRKHQIRKHFSIIGNSIVGDDKFKNKFDKVDVNSNFYLHSMSINFFDKNKKIKIIAPLPAYFENKLENMNYPINKLENNNDFNNLEDFQRSF